MSNVPVTSPCPIEELLADDPLAPGSDVERNTLDQGDNSLESGLPRAMEQLSETITIKEDDQEEAIMVDEEINNCYTCHQEFSPGCPVPALVVHVQQNLSSKLTVQVCLACYRRLDYDDNSEAVHEEFSGCPILSESKIIVNSPSISHKCFRCFSLICQRSIHPVSLQDGIMQASRSAVQQDMGYRFAVYLCDPCAHWKKQSGLMSKLTTLKFPAYDQGARSLYLPPITNVQLHSNSSLAGGKSINYPVSMLVNKARSLLERFKDNGACLSSPPTTITGSMMYIHTTKSKSSPSTHWSCDGFTFQKSSTRVVRIQNSDHVIRETNWVTAGPGDPEIKFRRRTITSSQMKDITLVHYLGEVDQGVKVSREVDLDDEDTNANPESAELQSYEKRGMQFFTNSFFSPLLVGYSPHPKQLYKLMPLATTNMFWNGEKWLCSAEGIIQTQSEVVRLVDDCKLSLEAIAEAFDGLTPQYIKQLKLKISKNAVQPKFNCWNSFSGPWLFPKKNSCEGKKISNVVQYLRVPVDTDFKLLLNCYIKDPERLKKIMNSIYTLYLQDKKVQLIQELAKPLMKKYRFKMNIQEDETDNPDDPGLEILDQRSNSFTDSASSGDSILPKISSVMGSVGGLSVMGSTLPSPAPSAETSTNLYATIHSRSGPAAIRSVFLPQNRKIHNPVSTTGHMTPVLPTQTLSKVANAPTASLPSPTPLPKVVVSGNKIILPSNFLTSGAKLVQIPNSDGTKRLVLINKSQSLQTSSKNTVTQTTTAVASIPPTSVFAQQQSANLPKSVGLIRSKNIVKEEPAVDPLETHLSANQMPNALPHQPSVVTHTKMNHLTRSAAVQGNICAEIAEECIFNKNFSDVLIYGTQSSKQKNPLKTHSLVLSAISPNLKQLLQKAERNGDGVYELVIPGVTLTEIEALLEEVIGTMLMPPKDDKSVTFNMSENLWNLFAGVRPGDSLELGKSWIKNLAMVPNSFSCSIKSMESLTDHWANQSVCDEQTGQMVIQVGTKRRGEQTSTSHGSSKSFRLSDWSKQIGSLGHTNIQEMNLPCGNVKTVDSEDDFEVVIDSVEDNPIQSNTNCHDKNEIINRHFNIRKDKLPIKAVSVNIRNIHCKTTTVQLKSSKKQPEESHLWPPCGSPERTEFDFQTYEVDPLGNDYLPREKMKTLSNIQGSMVKKKTPEKWIFSKQS